MEKIKSYLSKFEMIFSKFRYVVEFLISFITISTILKVILTKVYDGYFHRWFILSALTFLVLLVLLIIYNFKKSNRKIENYFLNVAIPIGICYMLAVIPGHVPDETTHFYKAYDLSNGNIITSIDKNGDSYIEVPAILSLYHHNKVKNYNEFLKLTTIETDYENVENVISTAQGNSSLMYILPALAFKISNVLNLNIIYGLLLGKILNFIMFLILIYFAIKIIPFGKMVFMLYVLMPMNLQQVTSISPDAFINTILLFYIAFSVYIIFKKEKIKKWEIALYIVLAIVSGIIKMVYIFIAGLGFLIVIRNDISKKLKIIIILVTITLGSIFTITTYLISQMYTLIPDVNVQYALEYNVDTSGQINEMIQNPEHAIEAFVHDWYVMQKEYVFMAIGSQLGWLEIQPSETIILLYLILLIVASLSERSEFEFNTLSKVWILLIGIGVILLVELAMYTGFTPISAEYIGGVQGRYYVPIYILALLCLIKKENFVRIKNSEVKFIIWALALNACVIFEIVKHFV